jgi:hypothetical protein
METVELNEFIKKTLFDIAKGVKEANIALRELNKDQNDYFTLRANKGHNSKVPGISFDIAINASKNQKDKAGFMVALATIGAGANVEKGSGAETAHRIKFEVGLHYDYQ